MNTNSFGFQPNLSNMENYLKENEKSQESSNVTWWALPPGMSSIRILPPWDPTGRVALPVYSHSIEYQGAGMKYKKYNWTCVNKTFGKPCNICEGLAKIAANGVDISNYEPSRRTFYLNAIVMYDPLYDRDIKSGKKPENCEGVAPGTHVLMRAPKTLYDWVVANITNPMVGDITSVTNGIDVFVTREGTGLGTTYQCTLSPNGRTAIPKEILDKIENLYDLDEVFSTGFEEDQVNSLVASLVTSSNAMSAGAVGMAANQMGGYQPQAGYGNMSPTPPNHGTNVQPVMTPQTTGYPPMNNPMNQGIPNVPAFGQAPSFGAQAAPQQFTAAPQMPTPVAPSTPSAGNTPDCFGKYNNGSVTCVTCPHELSCQKQSTP